MQSRVNTHIGKCLRALRIEKQISQTRLGDVVGVTFQQVQKYESGMSRISIENLLAFCEYLEVPLSYFMDDLTPAGRENENRPTSADLLDKKDAVQLIRYFSQIDDRDKRNAVLTVAKQMVPESAKKELQFQ